MDSLAEIKLNHANFKISNRAIKRLQNITQLQLAGNNLTSLPENFGKLTNLKNLNLAENKLNNLPPQIEKLENLEHLIFYKNNFTEIL